MDVQQVMAYELNGQRIGVWKTEDNEWFVSNTATGKCLRCLSCEQALDTFDACLEAINRGKLLN
jgi:hypothetical protein